MKFIEGGADIPDELVDAVLAGDVVFLCGAGVSKAVGLPLFDDLTFRIYAELGETFEHEAAERESIKKYEFDRTLRALEKRVRRPGSLRSPVRTACANHLQVPPHTTFPHHEAVLALSRDREGRSRVLTTNFDTLFERAAVNRGEELFSDAVKGLPKPGGPRDFGIHHLHGRIADPTLDLAETDLILTSADFGDAYLRDGWASRYVEDRMRTAMLVLLGYRAEDAALRLLLETLDVDRERFPDLRKVFALERAAPDSAAQWKAKGVTPVEFETHEALYETLKAWADYAERPAEFEQKVIARVFEKLPGDATDFDRSQLSSLKGRGNAPALLIEANPSMAWLPTLTDIEMVRYDDRWLAGWIRKNLQEPRAVIEVVARLGLFGPGLADSLSYNIEQYQGELSPLLRKSWALLIRHMRRAQPSPASGWYDLLPVLKRQDGSHDTIERLTSLLRPELKVSRRFTLDDSVEENPATIHDLMRVEYEPEENIAVGEVIDAWAPTTSATADANLITSLSHALDNAAADAIDIGLDGERGFGLIDTHVASVADHPQNRYRKGFLPIVRVIAEIWWRLANKEPRRAGEFIPNWLQSPYRINRRIALFACRHSSVAAALVKKALLEITATELFLTGSVEAHRLLIERWSDLDPETHASIEQRLRIGPPADSFQPDADAGRYIDRSRYDVIGNLMRDGIELSPETRAEYASITDRNPEWRLRPHAQSGFHRWFEMSSGPADGEPKSFEGVADNNLVEMALNEDASERWPDAQSWRHLCERDPERVLRALSADAQSDRWRADAWRDFLVAKPIDIPAVEVQPVADLLLRWPVGTFGQIAAYAVDWLGKPEVLGIDAFRWKLWDKLAATLSDDGIASQPAEALVQESFGQPAVKLTDVLLQLMPASEAETIFTDQIGPRLDLLIAQPGRLGQSVKIRLAVDLNYVFERAPEWSLVNLVPLFDWSSSDALAVWYGRQYSTFIGGTKLFALTKSAFLSLFSRSDVSDEVLRTFAEWLVSMLLANQRRSAGYDLSFVEARSALRRTKPTVLQSVAHDLAVEMQRATPAEKVAVWRDTVGPVFKGIWPQDVDLLSGVVTFKLLQILRATGEAFPEAADAIEPFIVPEEKEQGTAAHSLGDADDILFSSAPSKMLDIVAAVVGKRPTGSVFQLQKVLDRIGACEGRLVNTRKFQALRQMAR